MTPSAHFWTGDTARPCAQAQNRSFDIFILQQSPLLRFNRGALLNAGVLLLAGSEYDHFCFHDVDTLPTLQCAATPAGSLTGPSAACQAGGAVLRCQGLSLSPRAGATCHMHTLQGTGRCT